VLFSFLVACVVGDGVCGPLYTSDCSQFTTATLCTCAPGSTDQTCATAPQLEYFTYDATSQTFMYCQWQFAPFTGVMQCGQGSTCTPSATPALQVCQSNLQAQATTAVTLQITINLLNQQLLQAQANATLLQSQLELAGISNQELRMQLATTGIFAVDLESEAELNYTRDVLSDLALNQSLTYALHNSTYFQRLICGAHQGCCAYSGATSSTPFLVASLILAILVTK